MLEKSDAVCILLNNVNNNPKLKKIIDPSKSTNPDIGYVRIIGVNSK